MLDIKLLRQKPDWAKAKLAARGVKAEKIDEVLALDEQRRTIIQETEGLKLSATRFLMKSPKPSGKKLMPLNKSRPCAKSANKWVNLTDN